MLKAEMEEILAMVREIARKEVKEALDKFAADLVSSVPDPVQPEKAAKKEPHHKK